MQMHIRVFQADKVGKVLQEIAHGYSRNLKKCEMGSKEWRKTKLNRRQRLGHDVTLCHCEELGIWVDKKQKQTNKKPRSNDMLDKKFILALWEGKRYFKQMVIKPENKKTRASPVAQQ